MHDYLRAIGFGRLNDRKSLQHLLGLVMANPDQQYFAQDPDRPVYWEKSKNFLPGAGITVRGETDENGKQIYEYFFPHFHGEHVSFTDTVDLEKEFEREEYKGVCELPDMGIMMVFHMNRLKDYASKAGRYGFLEKASVKLSALSISGSVLLPLARPKKGPGEKEKQAAAGRRFEAAQKGDPEALAELAIQEFYMYNQISQRIFSGEDVLSVVESSFMPFGTASEQYSVLGDIVECKEEYNQLSGEKIWLMTVLCSGKLIDLCINAEDLIGEPKAGRRFRGTIWLQGQLS
jgi:hypothetical protein